jgi:hypothetical protein
MDYDVANAFKPYLGAGETVRWAGMPKQGLTFRPYDLFLIPFSIMWGGFAIFWEMLVVSTDGPIFMKLWGVPFVLIGLYMLIGRFFYDSYVRKRTRYALTDRSALILGGINGDKLTTIDLAHLQELNLRGGSPRGTIIFGPDNNHFGAFRNRYEPPPAPEFFEIEDAAGVFAIIQQKRRAAA